MKKLALFMAASVLAASMLAGCSAANEIEVDVENLPTYEQLASNVYEDKAYAKNLNTSKLVTLGEYKGIEVEVEKVNVDDSEVEEYINQQLEWYPMQIEVTDRTVEEGDTVNLDYTGLLHGGIEFEGGTAQDQELVIGSGMFIEGFEDGMIGMEIGEVRHLELVFPEEYGSEELAGQDVVFVVTLNKIFTEEPAELNEEWLAQQAIEGVQTPDEYREYVYNMKLESDQARYDSDVINGVMDQVLGNAELKGNYTEILQRYFDAALANLQYQLLMYGMDFETFGMLSGGLSEEDMVNELKNSALTGVKQTLVTFAIAEAEGIELTEEYMQKSLEEAAAYYGFATAEEYSAAIGGADQNDDYKEVMLTEMVMEFLKDNAVITETEPAAEEAETQAAE